MCTFFDYFNEFKISLKFRFLQLFMQKIKLNILGLLITQ